MSWVEEQWWFGLEDRALEAEEEHNRIKELFYQGLWVTAKGYSIPIKDMTDFHLSNCIKMIQEGRLNRKWALNVLINEQKRRNDSTRSNH